MSPPVPAAPGVYIDEIGGMPRTIAGVETSACAFAGRAPGGPLAAVAGPVRVSSLAGFVDRFGPLDPACPMGAAVRDFFEQGGRHALILRLRHGVATGDDGADDAGPALADADYIGGDGRDGALSMLRDAEGFDLLCIPPDGPGADTSPAVYRAALALCVECRAMLLVDGPAHWDDLPALLDDPAAAVDALGLGGEAARNAALYYPRLLPPGAAAGTPARVASGAVAGVIARTDAAHGVWKAPAGREAVLAGVGALSVQVGDVAGGVLNQVAINCLRAFPGMGPVVWGARTMGGGDTMGDEFKYVPVRRLALYLERSVSRGIAWAVFEPNDASLWARLRQAVGDFMLALFRQGAFQGTTPRDGYFVKCDATTVTAQDRAAGVCNIIVGFAPLKPGEFVVLAFAQATLPEPGGTESAQAARSPP